MQMITQHLKGKPRNQLHSSLPRRGIALVKIPLKGKNFIICKYEESHI